MKKLLSVFLSIAMIAASIVMPISVSAEDTLVFPVLDFENVDTSLINSSETNGWMNAEQYRKPGSIKSHYVGVLPGYNSNGALAIDVTTDYRLFEYVVTDYKSDGTTLIPRPAGKYRFIFDLKPGEGTFELKGWRGTNGNTTDGIKFIELAAGELAANDWYQVEMFMDLTTTSNNIKYFITDKYGVLEKTGSASWGYINESSGLCVLQFGRTLAGGTASGAGRLERSFAADNIALYSTTFSALPTEPTIQPIAFTDSNVTLTANGAVAENWLAVTPGEADIAINFGANVVESTLTEESVQLASRDGAVSATRSFADGVYTLSGITTTAGATYTIKLTDDIEYTSGVKHIPYVNTFTTASANETLLFPVLHFENVPTDLMNSSAAGGWMEGTEPFKVPGSIRSYYVGVLPGYNSDGALAVNAGVNQRMFEYVVTDYDENGTLIPRPDGKYRLTFDLKPGAGTFELYTYHGTTADHTLGKNLFTIAANELSSSEWYQVEMFIDSATKQTKYFITDADGILVKSGNPTYTNNLCVIQFGTTVSGGTAEGSGNLTKSFAADNIAFYSTSIAALPETPTIQPTMQLVTLTDDKITIKAGETVADNWLAVDPSVNEISIDLGAKVVESTLTEESVQLTSRTGAVSATRSLENGIYKLSNLSLTAGTTYTIKLTDAVKYTNGKLAPYVNTFTTASENETLLFPVLHFENVPTDLMNSGDNNGWMNTAQYRKPGSIKSNYVGVLPGYNSDGALAIDVTTDYRLFEYVVTDYKSDGTTLIPRPAGKYRFTFDLKPGEGTFELKGWRGTNGNTTDGIKFIELVAGELAANDWYQVEMFMDLTTTSNNIKYFITDKCGVLEKTGSASWGYITESSGLCVLQFGRTLAGGTSSNDGKLEKSFVADNIALYSTTFSSLPTEPTIQPDPYEPEPPTVPNGETLIAWENFERIPFVFDEGGANGLGTTFATIKGGIVNRGGTDSLTQGKDGKGLGLTLGSGLKDYRGQIWAVGDVDAESGLVGVGYNNGTYKLTFDLKPGDNEFKLYAGKYAIDTDSTTSYNTVFTLAANELNADDWYDVEVFIDFVNNKAMTYTIKDAEGTVVKSGDGTYLLDALAGIGFVTYTRNGVTTDTTFVVDNLIFTEYNRIALADTVLTVTKANGTVNTTLEGISPVVGAVKIDFGTEMKKETVTDTTVKLVKYVDENTETEVSGTRTWVGNVYQIVPGTLSANATYKVVITSGIETANDKLIDAREFTFSTGETGIDITDTGAYVADYIFDDKTNDDIAAVDGKNGFQLWGGVSIVDGGRDGAGKALGVQMLQPTRSTEYYLAETIGEGKAVVEFSILPADTETTGAVKLIDTTMAEHGNALAVVTFNNAGALTVGYGSDIKTVANTWTAQWYDVKAVLDFDKGSIDVEINSADKTINYAITNLVLPIYGELRGLSFGFARSAAAEVTNKLDDLKIQKIYTKAPKLTADSIKLYAGETEQTALASVSNNTNRVDVNFGQMIKSTDITSDNIYITKKGETTKLDVSGIYENGIYTMVIPTTLGLNTTYTVYVEPVSNVSDYKMAQGYTVDFTTAAGKTEVTLQSITQDNTAVTNVSGIAPATESKIIFDYKNSTGSGETLYIVAAYFKGDLCVKADYMTEVIAEDVTDKTYEIPYTTPAAAVVDGIDKVQIMVVDGLNTMVPLTASLDLNN